MVQRLMDASTVKSLQALAKGLTHLLGHDALFAGLRLVVLVNVVELPPLEGTDLIIQSDGGHAPRAN